MKSKTSFQVFFLKEHRKNSLKSIVFPWESVFTAIAKILQGHRTAQRAHCALCSKTPILGGLLIKDTLIHSPDLLVLAAYGEVAAGLVLHDPGQCGQCVQCGQGGQCGQGSNDCYNHQRYFQCVHQCYLTSILYYLARSLSSDSTQLIITWNSEHNLQR